MQNNTGGWQRVGDHWLLPGVALLGVFFLLWLFSGPRQPVKRDGGLLSHARTGTRYVGFSVFGADWAPVQEFSNEAERLAHLEEQGYQVAKHTSQLYGNLIRTPLSVWMILEHNPFTQRELLEHPVYELEDTVINTALNSLQVFLDENAATIERGRDAAGTPLHWGFLDAFLTGIHRYNTEVGVSSTNLYQPVYVDLLIADKPPTLIIEAPTDESATAFGGQTAEKRLWASYKHFQEQFIRQLIRRYGEGYAREGVPAPIPVAVAIEMLNEPDYVWLPDEVQFERALKPDAYPCDKYVTQLHLPQIPQHDLPGKGCRRHLGYYREQRLGLPQLQVPLQDFHWGRKFDKYVELFAEFHDYAASVAQDEIKRGGARMVVASSAVTHVNLDWFMRMFRANVNAFRAVDAVAIHPYHWPEHDIHDLHFVGPQPQADWRMVNPREFASHYFKRFDFVQALAQLVNQPDEARSYGLAGKPIWVTEFGLQTKKLGKFNAPYRDNQRMFIYDRATPVPDGIHAIMWEDRWDAFLNQVSADYLRRNHVETFLIYTLRESTQGQTNDDDHSNFALYRADWSCRVAPEVIQRIAKLFREFRDG